MIMKFIASVTKENPEEEPCSARFLIDRTFGVPIVGWEVSEGGAMNPLVQGAD
jgi:hypothetical protein